jgi:hypothetical protein
MDKTVNRTLLEAIAEIYHGKPAAILCARYWYRGVVAEVGKNYIHLTNVRAVEVTGAANTEHPQTEDPVPSDMLISSDAIEQVCQPTWAWFEMPGEKPEGVKKAIADQKKAAEKTAEKA